MALDLGTLVASLRLDDGQFNSAINAVPGKVGSAGTAAGVAMQGAMLPSLGRIAGAVGVAFSVGSLIEFGKSSINAASDAGESANAIKVAFGDSAGAIADLGKQSVDKLNMTTTDFNAIATRFSGFASTIAGEGGNVAGVIDDLTTRGADFASVFNMDAAESMALFQSGLAGETEPLRKFGIDLSAAAVEAYALSKGIWDGTGTMTEAQKVQARYGSLMEQTSKTQGDLANTADSYANKQRNLSAEFETTKAAIGEALIPIREKLMGFVDDVVLPGLENFGQFLKDNPQLITTVAAALGAMVGALIVITAVQWAWNAALAANPMTWIIIGIIALIGVIVALAMNWETVTKWVSDVWAGFVGWLTDGLEALAQWWNDLWAGIGKALEDIWNGIVQWFTDAVTNVVNFVRDYWGLLLSFFIGPLGLVIQWIVNNWDGIVKFFQDTIKNIGKFFTDGFNAIGKFLGDVWNNITKGITDWWNDQVAFFSSIPDKIMGFFSGVGSWLYNVGRDLINGLFDGINSLASNIGKFFLDILPDWIVAPFKAALGIHSPSKVFADYGKNTIQGYLKGIEKMQPALDNRMSDLMSDTSLNVSANANSAASRMSNTVNNVTYVAAENASLSAEEQLFAALNSPRVRSFA